MGASQVTATINLTTNTFNGITFQGNLVINGNTTIISFTPVNNTIVISDPTTLTPALSQGSYSLNFTYLNVDGTTNGTLTDNQIIGNVTFQFNDIPSTIIGPLDMTYSSAGDSASTATVNININCLHGSSLISIKDGFKRLDQIKEGDEVISGKDFNEYTRVKGVSQCWLTFMGIDHDAIVFEKGSLGVDEPNQRLIIDPGHPMCTREEYLERGSEALRPAGTYWEELKGEKIYIKKWTDIFVQSESSVRYDLILEEPFNTYLANGMVIRAKGYRDHRYKQLV